MTDSASTRTAMAAFASSLSTMLNAYKDRSSDVPKPFSYWDGVHSAVITAANNLSTEFDTWAQSPQTDDFTGSAFPGEYFLAIESGGGQTIGLTTTVTVTMDTTVHADSIYSFSSSVLTVLASGLYSIAFQVSLDGTTSFSYDGTAWLEINGSIIPGTAVGIANIGSRRANGASTISRRLTQNDQVRIRSLMPDGLNTATVIPNGVSLSLTRLAV